MKNHPEKTVLYITANTFRAQYADAAIKNDVNNFIHFYQKIDVLIIDDIHDFTGKTKTQEVFFHIFNHLSQMNKQLIFTCDKPLIQLEGISERLVSRFKAGAQVKIEEPDYETRLEILKNKFYKDGVNVSDEILEYIAQKLKTNVREIEGFYVSIIAHSIPNNGLIDIALIDRLLGNFVKISKKGAVTVELIQKVVSEYYKIGFQDLNSKSRKRNIVQARQMVMHLAKKHTNHSLSEIGFILGKKNHATVLYAIKSIQNLIETDSIINYDFLL